MKFVSAVAFSDPAHLLDIARTADACGWEAVALSDHVCFPQRLASPYPYSDDGKPYWASSTPWPDPWVAIGAMAAVTSRLRFLTNVFVLPSRHPLLVAKAVGTAAVLSNNRVILGVGVGWMREEFDLLGQDFSTRGGRTNEAIEVLRALWRGGMVEYHGKFYDFAKLEMSPAPSQPVPIYVGGESAPALRRAARYADGWISVLHSLEEIKGLARQLAASRGEFGRSQVPFDVCVSCNDVFDLDGYRRLEDIGVTTVLTMPWALYGEPATQLDAKRRALQRFADEVIHPLG